MLFRPKSSFFRVIQITLTFIFLSTNLDILYGLDQKSETVLQKKSNASFKSFSDKSLKSVVIPQNLALLKESHTENSDRLVIHIQDVHANFDAQMKISQIMQNLIHQYWIKLVCVEGAEGPISVEAYREFSDKEAIQKTAEYLMKEGMLVGSEYEAITTDHPFRFVGVEDMAVHSKNLNEFRETLRTGQGVIDVLDQLRIILEDLKKKNYSKDMVELDRILIQYHEKGASPQEYFKALERFAHQLKIELKEMPNLVALLQAQEIEGQINYEKADKERDQLLQRISRSVSKEDLQRLVKKTLQLRLGKISPFEYYDTLEAMAWQLGGGVWKDFPNFHLYLSYMKVFSKTDSQRVFEEAEQLESLIKEKLFSNDVVKRLDQLSKDLFILKNFLSLMLTSKDLDYYHRNADRIRPATLLENLKELGGGEGISKFDFGSASTLLAQWTGAMDKAEAFYQTARTRDLILVENTLRQMEEEGTSAAILVTGGFHTEGMTQEFKKRGISYMVLTPNLTEVPESNLYLKIMMEQEGFPLRNLVNLIYQTGASASKIYLPLSTASASKNKNFGTDEVSSFVDFFRFVDVAFDPGDRVLGQLGRFQILKIEKPIEGSKENEVRVNFWFVDDKGRSVSGPIFSVDRRSNTLKLENEIWLSFRSFDEMLDHIQEAFQNVKKEPVNFQAKIKLDSEHYGPTSRKEKTLAQDIIRDIEKDNLSFRFIISDVENASLSFKFEEYDLTFSLDSELVMQNKLGNRELRDYLNGALSLLSEEDLKTLLDGVRGKTLTVALLDASEHPFGNHLSDKLIGINHDVFKLQGAHREIALIVGLIHELRHEALKSDDPKVHQDAEQEFLKKDIELTLKLLQTQSKLEDRSLRAYVDALDQILVESSYIEGLRELAYAPVGPKEGAASIEELLTNIKDTVRVTSQAIEILNRERFRAETVDYLAYEAGLSQNADVKAAAQRILREAAESFGLKSASIHDFYVAKKEEKWGHMTVPAVNGRTDVFHTLQQLFRASKEQDVGALILELARSEMNYSAQDPDEFTAVGIAAAIRQGYEGLLFFQGDHYQVNKEKYAKGGEEREKELKAIEHLIRKAVLAGKYNIDIDPSTLVNEEALDEITKFEREIVDQYLKENSHLLKDLDENGLKALRRQLVDDLGAANISFLGVGKRAQLVELYRNMHKDSIEVTMRFIRYIRALEKEIGLTKPISIGIEERHIDNPKHKNNPSTVLGSMTLAETIFILTEAEKLEGPSKISLQTGTMHGVGGEVDFGIFQRHLNNQGKIGLALFVQHGASTLEKEDFNKMQEGGVGEVHLATEYQKIEFDVVSRMMPELAQEMIRYLVDLMGKDAAKDKKFRTMWNLAFGDPTLAIESAAGDEAKIAKYKALAEKQAEKSEQEIATEILGDSLPKGLKGTLKDLVKELSKPFKNDLWNLPQDVRNEVDRALYEEFKTIVQKLGASNSKPIVEKILPYDQQPVLLPPRPATLQAALQLGNVENSAVKSWVQEMLRFTGASEVELVDDLNDERLLKEAVEAGELIALPDGNYYARSHPQDVARSEERTFVATKDPNDKGLYDNWRSSDELKPEVEKRLKGSMKGKKLYVIPYLMGPADSPFSQVGVQVTDSRYVALNMIRMTKVGKVALKNLGESSNFVRGIHSTGDLDKIKRGGPEDDRYFVSFPDERTIMSFGSGYGGNALLGKKFHSLRQAGYDARKEGWLAEHMLIVGIEDTQTGETRYIAAAFPSASGKTNLAMIVPPKALGNRYKAHLIGDDIAWLRKGKDGHLYATNPENGFFGVVPGTNEKTNPNAIASIRPGTKTIFTNVAYNEKTGEVWWEGKEKDIDPEMLLNDYPKDLDGWRDWQGKLIMDRPVEDQRNSKKSWAHPNSRFTARAVNAPNISKEWQNSEGVPISAILFGGRLSQGEPLIRQLFDPASGVYDGAVMGVEATAAAEGKEGQFRPDPMAMRPFFSYNEGDYFKHWLEVMGDLEHPPMIAHVNWFRRDKNGKFIWPGYGDNLRPILWLLARAEGKTDGEAAAIQTPIGFIPVRKALNLEGLDISDEKLNELLRFDPSYWERELERRTEYLNSLGNRTPRGLSEAHLRFADALARYKTDHIQIRPDIAKEYPDIFGPKTVNGRDLNVEELIAKFTKEFSPEFAKVLSARQEFQKAVAAGAATYGFADPNHLIEDADGHLLSVAQIRKGMLDNLRGEDSYERWRLKDAPEEVKRPGLQGTGPADDLGMAMGAINAGPKGAASWMWDWEDAGNDWQDKLYRAWRYLKQLLAGEWDGKTYVHAEKKKEYQITAPKDQRPVIFHRVPGIHLRNRQIKLDGKNIPAIVPALIMHTLNNYDSQVKNGSGIYFYVPKIETPEEALLVAKILKALEENIDVPRGTIRIEMLNERGRYDANQEEIMWVLRDWLIGPNVGRWDYINSRIEMGKDDPNKVFPDPHTVGMTEVSMTEYTRRNAILTLLVGGFPVGGMSAVMKVGIDKNDPPEVRAEKEAINQRAVRNIWFDKLRERLTGLLVIDGKEYDAYRQSWVATTEDEYVKAGAEPLQAKREDLQALVDQLTPDERKKLKDLGLITTVGKKISPDGKITEMAVITPYVVTKEYLESLYSTEAWERLFATPNGDITIEGLEYSLYMAAEYGFQQLNGNNAAAIDDVKLGADKKYISGGTRLMNDFATYEIFWHWPLTILKHAKVITKDGVMRDGTIVKAGTPVTPLLMKKLLALTFEEAEKKIDGLVASGKFKFDRSKSPLIMEVLERQFLQRNEQGEWVPQEKWIMYGSRVLLSLVDVEERVRRELKDQPPEAIETKVKEERAQILDAIFSPSREEVVRKVQSGELSQNALAVYDFVYDIFEERLPAEIVRRIQEGDLTQIYLEGLGEEELFRSLNFLMDRERFRAEFPYLDDHAYRLVRERIEYEKRRRTIIGHDADEDAGGEPGPVPLTPADILRLEEGAANLTAPFIAGEPDHTPEVTFKAALFTAAAIVAEGLRGNILDVDPKDKAEVKKRKDAADGRAKQVTEAVFVSEDIMANVHVAEGIGRDEVEESFRGAEVVNPQGKNGVRHILIDVIEGTNATASNNKGKKRQEISSSESGGTSAIVSGEGVASLGNAPDIYAGQIFTYVPEDKRQEVQTAIEAALEAEDEETLERTLQTIASTNGITINDVEFVIMKRGREARRLASLKAIQQRYPGLEITEISDGTVAHGLLASFGVKPGAGKHKIMWTVGGSAEAFMNLAVASSLPGAVGAIRLYSKNMNKTEDGSEAQDLSRRYAFDESERAELRDLRPEDAEKIMSGERLFTITDVKGAVEGSFSFITDNGVFNQPGVTETEPGVFRVHTLRVKDGKPVIVVEDVRYDDVKFLFNPVTEELFRTNIRSGLAGLASLLAQREKIEASALIENASAVLDSLVVPISNWWTDHARIRMSDGTYQTIDAEFIGNVVGEEIGKIEKEMGTEAYVKEKYELAHEIFDRLIKLNKEEDFLPILREYFELQKPEVAEELRQRAEKIARVEERWKRQRVEQGRHIRRHYTAEDVARHQTYPLQDLTVQNEVAAKFNDRLRRHYHDGTSIKTFGPFDESSILTMAEAGIEGVYVGGFAESYRDGVGDKAQRPYTYMGETAARYSRILMQHERQQSAKRSKMSPEELAKTPKVDYLVPMFLDIDTGHLAIKEMVEETMTRGTDPQLVAAVHKEDQAHGCKECGHRSGKVLVSTSEAIRGLKELRFQLDVMGLDTLIVSRTDAEAAEWITSNLDEEDQPFILGATNPDVRPYYDVIREAWESGISEDEVMEVHARWRQEAGVVTLGEAVASQIEAREQSGQPLTMSSTDWKEFAKTASHKQAVARAKELGIHVHNASEWRTLSLHAPQVLSEGIHIMWDWDLPKTEERERTLWMIQSGIEMASARSAATAPYYDIGWMEQAHPDIEQTKQWAEAIDRAAMKYVEEDLLPGLLQRFDEGSRDEKRSEIIASLWTLIHRKMTRDDVQAAIIQVGLSPEEALDLINAAIKLKSNNTSPSFKWRAKRKGKVPSDEELSTFLDRQGFYTQFQFITYAGSQLNHAGVRTFINGPDGFKEKGMLAWANLQDKAIAEGDPYFLRSQEYTGNYWRAEMDLTGRGSKVIGDPGKDTMTQFSTKPPAKFQAEVKESSPHYGITSRNGKTDAQEIMKDIAENHKRVILPAYDVKFLVDPELVNKMGDEALGALIKKALDTMEDKAWLESLRGQTIALALLDQSESLFENHLNDKPVTVENTTVHDLIGINPELFKLPEVQRNIALQVGVVHELRHAALLSTDLKDHEAAEAEFVEKDIILTQALLKIQPEAEDRTLERYWEVLSQISEEGLYLDELKQIRAAGLIREAFDSYWKVFQEITHRSKSRFENKEWSGILQDAVDRLKSYGKTLDEIEGRIRSILGDRLKDQSSWLQLKEVFLRSVSDRYDKDLALTFFYSVMRRVFLEDGIPIEYSDDGIGEGSPIKVEKLFQIYPARKITQNLMKDIVKSSEFNASYEDLTRDAKFASLRINADLRRIMGSTTIDSVEILKPVFFRNKGAYVVGRIRSGEKFIPLVLALRNEEKGITIDAVLTNEKDVSNLFGFTRSNFHVDVGAYRELVDFLETVMPTKGRAAIYSAIGFIHPAKIVLIKDLRRNLKFFGQKFEMTKGTKGWVMVTFTHPSLPYVFKVISDKSEKDTIHSRQQVMEKYRLVHEMDRAGRMLDALAFTNLEFQKDLFPKELLDELKQRAPSVIVEEGDRIIINNVEVHKVKPLSTVITHLYAQRKVTPLDFYLAYHIVAYYKLRIQESKDPEEIKAFEEMIQRILKDFTYYNSYLRDSVADSEEKERLQNSIQKARDDVLEEADKLAKESKDSRDVENEIRKVLIDFGLTIRDLAAAGIWVGDVKTKNYGVTQHGRVVSYDYDELDLLTSREFIENPPPYYPAPEDDWRDSNYWDKVVYRRVFLRDLESEMGIPLEYRDFFSRVHDYLFKEQYWKDLQEQIQRGEVPDLHPYPFSRRLKAESTIGIYPEAQVGEWIEALEYHDSKPRDLAVQGLYRKAVRYASQAMTVAWSNDPELWEVVGGSQFKFDAVAVAVDDSNFEDIRIAWGDLPLTPFPDETLQTKEFTIQSDSSRVDIITSAAPGSDIDRFLKRHGQGIQHVEIVVDDIEKVTDFLKQRAAEKRGPKPVYSKPKLGAEGTWINFVLLDHPNGGRVLIQLVQAVPVKQFRIAVVGSDSSRINVVKSLIGQEDVGAVDVFDSASRPDESGEEIFKDSRVRFFGNVEVGRQVSVDELRQTYDLVLVNSDQTASTILQTLEEQQAPKGLLPGMEIENLLKSRRVNFVTFDDLEILKDFEALRENELREEFRQKAFRGDVRSEFVKVAGLDENSLRAALAGEMGEELRNFAREYENQKNAISYRVSNPQEATDVIQRGRAANHLLITRQTRENGLQGFIHRSPQADSKIKIQGLYPSEIDELGVLHAVRREAIREIQSEYPRFISDLRERLSEALGGEKDLKRFLKVFYLTFPDSRLDQTILKAKVRTKELNQLEGYFLNPGKFNRPKSSAVVRAQMLLEELLDDGGLRLGVEDLLIRYIESKNQELKDHPLLTSSFYNSPLFKTVGAVIESYFQSLQSRGIVLTSDHFKDEALNLGRLYFSNGDTIETVSIQDQLKNAKEKGFNLYGIVPRDVKISKNYGDPFMGSGGEINRKSDLLGSESDMQNAKAAGEIVHKLGQSIRDGNTTITLDEDGLKMVTESTGYQVGEKDNKETAFSNEFLSDLFRQLALEKLHFERRANLSDQEMIDLVNWLTLAQTIAKRDPFTNLEMSKALRNRFDRSAKRAKEIRVKALTLDQIENDFIDAGTRALIEEEIQSGVRYIVITKKGENLEDTLAKLRKSNFDTSWINKKQVLVVQAMDETIQEEKKMQTLDVDEVIAQTQKEFQLSEDQIYLVDPSDRSQETNFALAVHRGVNLAGRHHQIRHFKVQRGVRLSQTLTFLQGLFTAPLSVVILEMREYLLENGFTPEELDELASLEGDILIPPVNTGKLVNQLMEQKKIAEMISWAA